jgi:predicted DNA binding CopG/RHH family protein
MTESLDTDERELLNSYEQGEWQSVKTLREDLRQYQAYAATLLEQGGQVSIALSDDDLKAIQRKAQESGVSYQKFIANVVHEFVSGRLVERPGA